MNVPKSFIIITLGCKVNQFESACLQAELLKAGWVEARRGERIDVAIVNTCIVTQRAAHQSRQAIRKLIRENPNAVTAGVGCYAQVFPDELAGIQGIGMIAGNTVKGELPELILNTKNTGEQRVILKNYQPEMPFDMLQLRRFPGRTKARRRRDFSAGPAQCSQCPGGDCHGVEPRRRAGAGARTAG